jgi:carbamoyltransferase
MIFANYCSDISPDDLGNGNLVWPGKIMGLSPYGNVIEEWLEPFIEFYKSDPDGGNNDYINKLKILSEKTGLIFDTDNKLSGQTEYDMAATSQRAFEECFLEVAKPYFKKYPDLPICMAGGCSLNIILNTRVKTEFNKEVFVGPNPSDCGIAVGNMLKHIKPKHPVDLTYLGLPILDEDVLSEYLSHHTFLHGVYNFKKIMNHDSDYHFTEQIEFDEVIDDIINGKIVGIIQNNSEHGPRALGNRSIVCNPMIPEMKDILNFKVKNREWFRPFAPIVRLEDINEYFIFDGESRWMSFSPKVKPEWREKLPSITHVDGTARVQTITREQNTLLYDIITSIKEKTGVGVLLNTSFNVNGKPILSTYKDAFEIFHTTKLDALIIKDLYIHK